MIFLILPDVKMILLPQIQLEPVPVCVTGRFRSWLTVVIALDILGRKSLGGVGCLVLMRKHKRYFVGFDCCGELVDQNVDPRSGSWFWREPWTNIGRGPGTERIEMLARFSRP
jgi:hypothetical protein